MKKTRYALGFDPSANHPCLAIVGTDGSVRASMIRNEYKKSEGRILYWDKLEQMMQQIDEWMEELEPTLPVLEAWCCEAQYCASRRNNEHNVRLGWVSAIVYAWGYKKCERVTAPPAVWTQGVPKEIRHEELLQELVPESDWTWIGPQTPPFLMDNIYDAVGLARWGLEQVDERNAARLESIKKAAKELEFKG